MGNLGKYICVCCVALCVAPFVLVALVSWLYPGSDHAVVKIAIVCDKSFGDRFQHNRTNILEYWAEFMIYVQLPFKNLRSTNVTIKVSSITVISSVNQQSFIENARNSKGEVESEKSLSLFGKWMDERSESFPEYDVAMAVTAYNVSQRTIGITYNKGACAYQENVFIIKDTGDWNVITAAHEIAHLLGSHHDENCTKSEPGFIMSADVAPKQISFSNCTDKAIAKYLKSFRSSCLLKNDKIQENVSSPFQNLTCTPNPVANNVTVKSSGCMELVCLQSNYQNKWFTMGPIRAVDGFPCEYGENRGKCVKGECIPVDNNLKSNNSKLLGNQ